MAENSQKPRFLLSRNFGLLLVLFIIIIVAGTVIYLTQSKSVSLEGLGIELDVYEEDLLNDKKDDEFANTILEESKDKYIKLNLPQALDSIENLQAELRKRNNKNIMFLTRLKEFPKLTPSEQENLLSEIQAFINTSNTADVIKEWGIVKNREVFNRVFDSLVLENKISKSLQYALTLARDSNRVLREENVVLKEKNKERKVDTVVKEVAVLDEQSMDSLQEVITTLEDELKNSLDVKTFKFRPKKPNAKQNKEREYRLKDLKQGIEVVFELTAIDKSIKGYKDCTIVVNVPIKKGGVIVIEPIPMTRKIEFNKMFNEPISGYDFATGIYTCKISSNGKEIHYDVYSGDTDPPIPEQADPGIPVKLTHPCLG